MMSAAEMAEMVRVLAEAGMDAQEIAEACARVAGAGMVRDVHDGKRSRSPSAVRMARMRAKRRAESVTNVTRCDAPGADVDGAEMPETLAALPGTRTKRNTKVTSRRVTKRNKSDGRDKKERSPRPPKEKTTPPTPKGVPPDASPSLARVRIHRDDPVFAEIAAMRGEPIQSLPVSDRDGAWSFGFGEVQLARDRLARAKAASALHRDDFVSELEATN